jgi:hypothetical protein
LRKTKKEERKRMKFLRMMKGRKTPSFEVLDAKSLSQFRLNAKDKYFVLF